MAEYILSDQLSTSGHILSHSLIALHWVLLAKLLPAQAQAEGLPIEHMVHAYSFNTTSLGQSLKTWAQSGAV